MLVVDRSDIKTKLSKILSEYALSLQNLLHLPAASEINEVKLKGILTDLGNLVENLCHNSGKIGQKLRDNEFIATLQQKNFTPAGTCAYNAPAYNVWLQQNPEIRKQNLTEWLDNFTELSAIVGLLLELTRESTKLSEVLAPNGFYQINLDPKISYQMVRIAILGNIEIYPEISVGRHRLSVHFYRLNAFGRPEQVKQDLLFELACCKI